MTGNIFVAGFGDGAVRVFDTRMRPHETMVRKWKDDGERQWVRSVHMQRGGQRELLSASRNGTVRLWDIRVDQPLRTMRTTKDVLRTASTHEHLPVFAVYVLFFTLNFTFIPHSPPLSLSHLSFPSLFWRLPLLLSFATELPLIRLFLFLKQRHFGTPRQDLQLRRPRAQPARALLQLPTGP